MISMMFTVDTTNGKGDGNVYAQGIYRNAEQKHPEMTIMVNGGDEHSAKETIQKQQQEFDSL